MRSSDYLIKLLRKFLIFCFLVAGLDAFAQCSNKISVIERSLSPGDKTGFIKIKVESDVTYSVTLLSKASLNDTEAVVKRYSASGDQQVVFNDLSPERLYRVAFEFESDTRPICTRRMTDFMALTKDKE